VNSDPRVLLVTGASSDNARHRLYRGGPAHHHVLHMMAVVQLRTRTNGQTMS
jgi:hypothetical protein